MEYCEEHNIPPWCLPPHTSHLLQPLDVVVFQPFKHFHRHEVDAACVTGCTVNKVEFLAAIEGIRRKTFKLSSVKSAFKNAGIHPFNPEEVLSVVRAEQLVTAQESASSPAVPEPETPEHVHQQRRVETPRTIRSFNRLASSMRLRRIAGKSLVMNQFDAFMKAAQYHANIGVQAQEDLFQTRTAGNARASRAKAKRKVLQRGGALYVHEARSMVQSNEQELEIKAIHAHIRAESALA